MNFKTPLLQGTLIRRYQRFLADIHLETGEIITAHCPNSGRLLGVTDPGIPVWVEYTPGPKRRLSYTWHMAQVDGVMVGVNTWLPQILVREMLTTRLCKPLAAYTHIQEEVAYGQNSRIDFLLHQEGLPLCYVEVKNVHLKRGDTACFPDTATARGAKHMHELADQVRAGHRAVVIYVVQRQDCGAFEVAADIDPVYAAAVGVAQAEGVEFLSYGCQVSPLALKLITDQPLVMR